MTPLIRLTTAAVPPFALLISMTHLIAADQGPGDGFTAGIISSLGLTLLYASFGYREARRRLRRIHFGYALILGMAVAVVASILPLLVGEPLLALLEVSIDAPLVGAIRLTRAMLFDWGIYLVVLGGAMMAIDSLWRAAE